jgi:hypothetical protein
MGPEAEPFLPRYGCPRNHRKGPYRYDRLRLVALPRFARDAGRLVQEKLASPVAAYWSMATMIARPAQILLYAPTAFFPLFLFAQGG